jgi:hypothetical protein
MHLRAGRGVERRCDDVLIARDAPNGDAGAAATDISDGTGGANLQRGTIKRVIDAA